MLVNSMIEMLVNFADGRLAFHIGEMHFGPLQTCGLMLALAAASLSALNLWRIARYEDREKRLLTALRSAPHLAGERALSAGPPWYYRIGTVVGATRIVAKREQQRLLADLAAAGVKGYGHLDVVIAAKLYSGAAAVPICLLLLEWRSFFAGASAIKLVLLVGAFMLGWRGPDVVLSRLAGRRRLRLEAGMPDALDLLVICAEAGLSLDHAVEQVGRVLWFSGRDVAEEFAATAAEMRVSSDRSQALENMAQRTGLPSLRSIVGTLNQSVKFGTPLASALRVLAAEMRAARLARFEERAARLPVLLTLPLMVFILPSLIIVIGTPLGLRIVDMLGRGL